MDTDRSSFECRSKSLILILVYSGLSMIDKAGNSSAASAKGGEQLTPEQTLLLNEGNLGAGHAMTPNTAAGADTLRSRYLDQVKHPHEQRPVLISTAWSY
jgi:hypothetical protein